MAYSVSNVNILTETFESLIIRQNTLAWLTTNDVLTANATGAETGNTTVSKTGRLYGTFMSNSVIVQDSLRGGNTSVANNLTVTSNVDVYVAGAASPNFKIGNSTIITVLNSIGASFGNGTVNSVANTTAVVISNGSINTSINYLGITSGNVAANQTTIVVGANLVANTTAIRIGNSTVNTVITDNGLVVSNATVSSTISRTALSTNGTLSVTGSSTLSNTIAVTGNATFSNTMAVTGNAVFSNTFAATGNAVFSNTIAVTGNATFSNTMAVTGAASFGSDVTVKTDLTVQVSSNTDLGTDTVNNLLVYRFDKTSFSTAKLLVQVKKGTNTQISEIILAHNGSAAELTVYGTVSSPPSSSSSPLLATFTANLNSANVDLLIVQTQLNSSVKIVADLIK